MGRVHAACWQRIRGVRVAAVCVRNPASLARAVKVYGCVGEALPANLPPDMAVYTDAEKMLAEVKPDIVDVVLPTALHAAAVERALAHGAHVLCEKPLARDAREADRILRAAARAKGRFMVAQCLRFAPEYVYLKKLVASNRYGAVTAATFTRLTPPPCAPCRKRGARRRSGREACPSAARRESSSPERLRACRQSRASSRTSDGAGTRSRGLSR